jgi:CDP-paratose 2-epimerase
MSTALVTGSAGLIGSECVRFFADLGFDVVGIDSNAREYFFGADGSTDWNKRLLEKRYPSYRHVQADIRDTEAVEHLFEEYRFDLVIHAAAQPSHDWAAREPVTDFTINANGTMVLLEATRKHTPDAVFIFTSTNKVYGDNPNRLPLVETDTRWELPADHPYHGGIDEQMSLDHCTHSLFGVSKAAADLMVQEYGRYFGMKTGIFRGGCLTGPAHSPAQLHGFLAFLVSSIVEERHYTVFGYKGKQVRDNIHSRDVASAFYSFYREPRVGEVYNLGGSRTADVSVLEAIAKIEQLSGKTADYELDPVNRVGDHIWYVSDMSKFRSHYPDWNYTYDADSILAELVEYATAGWHEQP